MHTHSITKLSKEPRTFLGNLVTLTGKLEKKPVIRTSQFGKKTAALVIRTDDLWSDIQSGAALAEPSFHHIRICSHQLAHFAEYNLRMGMALNVTARQKTISWEGKDGRPMHRQETIIDDTYGTLEITAPAEQNQNLFGEQ